MSQDSLQNQVAIVSGALGDIGRAAALELARRGASVALSDIAPPAAAESLLADIRRLGRAARYDRIDVSDPAAVDNWIRTVEKELGLATLVVTSAAIVTIADVLHVTPEQWRRELAVNLDGSFFVARAAASRMLAAKRPGRIVFVGSWAAHAPHAHIPAYSVSKAGVRMLSQCLAMALAPHGITVNEIAPGFVDAGLSAVVFREKPGAREKAQSLVPTRQLISAADVAAQVAYLCSDASRQMTGSVLLMDGGLSLGLSGAAVAESPR